MHNHFSENLDLRKLILKKKPKVIVECGAGNGELTSKIAGLLDTYLFDFHVISDYPVPGMDSRIKWKTGLSYNALKEFKDGSIDLCILDTDHNYWTLMKELSSLFTKVSEGGLIAMHDVETFYHDTGMALKYGNDEPYPQAEIERMAPYGSLGDALIEFLSLKKMDYKLLMYNPESNGAAVIERKTQTMFKIMTPGPKAVFVK